MRRIKKARIEFISLCPKGVNKMPVLYKADGTVEFLEEVMPEDACDQPPLNRRTRR